MTTPKKFLAFDLGAESGRGIVGLLNGPKLELEVINRFPNEPVRTLDALHWDVLALYRDMLQTLLPVISSSLGMSLCVFAVSLILPMRWPNVARLGVEFTFVHADLSGLRLTPNVKCRNPKEARIPKCE